MSSKNGSRSRGRSTTPRGSAQQPASKAPRATSAAGRTQSNTKSNAAVGFKSPQTQLEYSLANVTADLRQAKRRLAAIEKARTPAQAAGYSASESSSRELSLAGTPALRSYALGAARSTFPSDGPLSQVSSFNYELPYTAPANAVELFLLMPIVPDGSALVYAANAAGALMFVASVVPKRDIGQATSAYLPLAMACQVAAQGSGNINAQLGAVETYLVPEAITSAILSVDLESHQFGPSLFNKTRFLTSAGKPVGLGLPIVGITRNTTPIPVTGGVGNAQTATGATYSRAIQDATVYAADQSMFEVKTPLNYDGKLAVTLAATSAGSGTTAATMQVIARVVNPAGFGLVEHVIGSTVDIIDAGSRKLFRLMMEVDLANLTDENGGAIPFTGVESIYFRPSGGNFTNFQSYFSVGLADWHPGISDMTVVYRHYAFSATTAFLADSKVWASYQYTIGNEFSSEGISSLWLPGNEHLNAQQRFLASGTFDGAIARSAALGLEVGHAGFWKDIWGGIKHAAGKMSPAIFHKFDQSMGYEQPMPEAPGHHGGDDDSEGHEATASALGIY